MSEVLAILEESIRPMVEDWRYQAQVEPLVYGLLVALYACMIIVGATGNPGQANYAASKGGLVAMSKAIAAEVASRGITVNCIAPGFIGTEMTDALNDDQKSKLLTSIPAGRLGSPDDIASAAVYLASEEGGYMTGATLHVNGGMAML